MELISREEAIKALQKWNCRDSESLTINPYEVLRDIPTIEERKEGEWLDNKWLGEKCSICSWELHYINFGQFKYCPNCGAKMDDFTHCIYGSSEYLHPYGDPNECHHYGKADRKTENSSFKLNHPLTEEDWNKLMDTELEQCTEVVFHTKKGKEVVFIKKGE